MEIGAYDADVGIAGATAEDGRTRVAVYRPGPTAVVLGRGSRPEVELDLDACRADDALVLRRQGGGCAVVVDPGSVVVAVSMRSPGIGRIRAIYDALGAWLVEGLARCGITGVRMAGISDLVLGPDDRKIAGSCLARSRDLALFSCSILASPRVDLMERWLRHPPREPAYRRGRPHREFVGSLEGVLGPGAASVLEAGLRLGLSQPPA